jgi:UDP-3-O-[3-hydroxymyristoyl] glucosamine N-acyltransferase
MKTYKENGTGIYIHPENVHIGANVTIGHCSCIGFGDPHDGEIIIEDNVTVGAFCVIYFGVTVGEGVRLDDYTKIGAAVRIGRGTQVLYGKHVSEEAIVGEECIIGGHIADRTVIEDKVTYLGEIAHSHRDASQDWDNTVEPSPIIRKGSVVGVNALIIGGRRIGPGAYIGAGEIVRTDVGKDMALMKGECKALSEFRGMFRVRSYE